MELNEKALQEASAKLRKLRLDIVGGRKEHPIETVKSVVKRGLGGMYDDEAIKYILQRGLFYYYQAVEQSVQPTVEACPEDRHDYYTALLSYLFCPYCGERLHSG